MQEEGAGPPRVPGLGRATVERDPRWHLAQAAPLWAALPQGRAPWKKPFFSSLKKMCGRGHTPRSAWWLLLVLHSRRTPRGAWGPSARAGVGHGHLCARHVPSQEACLFSPEKAFEVKCFLSFSPAQVPG